MSKSFSPKQIVKRISELENKIAWSEYKFGSNFISISETVELADLIEKRDALIASGKHVPSASRKKNVKDLIFVPKPTSWSVYVDGLKCFTFDEESVADRCVTDYRAMGYTCVIAIAA